MKNRVISIFLTAAMTGLLFGGCGTVQSTPVPAAEPAEEAPAEEDLPLTDEDDSDYPEDFLQNQAGKITFKDFDEAISFLKEGQGYALIKVYGYDGDILAVTETVFEADHSAPEASLYCMKDGEAHFLGVISGNGSAFPIRLADGILYGGDNHQYDAWFMTKDGGIMQKDYVYDDVETGDGKYGGFLREENTFDNDKDFTGGKEEFEAMMAERDSKPIIEFTMVSGADEETTGEGALANDLNLYASVLLSATPDSYYAFADLNKDVDVLLLAGADDVFSDDEGNYRSTGADVYVADEEGLAWKCGSVRSGTTALPIGVKDRTLYYGNHEELFSAVVDREKAELTETSSSSFDEVDDALTDVFFFPVSDIPEGDLKAAAVLPAYVYQGSDKILEAVTSYVVNEFGKHYNLEDVDVTIPYVLVAHVDESKDDDVVVYGNFWVDNLHLNGDTLESKSGGECPGAIHLKKDGDEYLVISMDILEDGNDFETSGKKIFGDHFNDFKKLYSDDKAKTEARTKAIADYVKANDLPITQYQDYGWDPVKLK